MREALPNPSPGPLRDGLIALNQAHAVAVEAALTGVLSRYLDRSAAVVLARAKGPKARRGTKWWVPTPGGPELEVKALDATYVVPDKLTDSLADDLRPVTLEIATDAARDTARRLGEPHPEDFSAYDTAEIERAVDEAIEVILGVAGRHTRELRQAVLDADTDSGSLDELLERVESAHKRGGNWVLMAGRTLANGLANAAAYDQALRLGCTHAQWISQRDGRVRPTHVQADGQVRRLGDRFRVGDFGLHHPADPIDLPDSWQEVANCRCRLLFRKQDENVRKIFEALDRIVGEKSAPNKAMRAVLAALALAAANPDHPITPTPQGYGLPPAVPVIELDEPVVGYRELDAPLDVVPGQRITPPDRLVLGLAPPNTPGASTLIVLIPAGIALAAAGGVVVLAADSALDVLGVGAEGVRTRLVSPETSKTPRPETRG